MPALTIYRSNVIKRERNNTVVFSRSLASAGSPGRRAYIREHLGLVLAGLRSEAVVGQPLNSCRLAEQMPIMAGAFLLQRGRGFVDQGGSVWELTPVGQNIVVGASNVRQSPMTDWLHRRGGALGFIFAMQGGAARRLWNVSGWISRAPGFVRP